MWAARVARAEHTIVAAATPWGRGAVAVLRLSGPDALDVARRMCPAGPAWRPRRASLRRALDGEQLVDEVLALWMPGPRSYTGEDVVELHGHGNPLLVERLLALAVRCGARPAREGEFTRRALLNGRMDLLGAESLAELIAASSPEALEVARAGVDRLSAAVGALGERLLDLAAEVEARFDSPGEELDLCSDEVLAALIVAVAAEAEALADTWAAGRVRLRGARVALVGPVNAGKSSLFNQLVGQPRALVSPEPGTTRDVIERAEWVEGLELTWLDTAGERDSGDALERAGIELGRALTEDVDLLLVVLPGHRPLDPAARALLDRTAGRRRLIVASHADLEAETWALAPDHRVSGRTGAGVAELRAAARRAVAVAPPSGARAMVTTQRQHELLRAVADQARAAAEALGGPLGPVVASEELTLALERLGELRGADVREEVLDRVFARFCIGK